MREKHFFAEELRQKQLHVCLDVTNLKIKKRNANKAYSLWRVNGYQQGFRFVANLSFGGQESASKPPQAICKPLAVISETRE